MAQTVTLHDDVSLEVLDEGIEVHADEPGLPPGADNLAFRAAAALPRPRGGPRGARITLRKRIPLGAGLGGGSSDAAATLIGLRRLWGLPLSDRDLSAIASGIGADVPLFLAGGTARLGGTGTRVEPLPDLSGYELLIVHPGPALSTREVYARASAALTSALKISSMARFKPTPTVNLTKEVETWVRAGNDLEPYARALCPIIGEIRNRLESSGASAAAMTGSGSAVFGVFRDRAAIRRARLEAASFGFAAFRCRPLGRREYRRRVGLD